MRALSSEMSGDWVTRSKKNERLIIRGNKSEWRKTQVWRNGQKKSMKKEK